MRKLGRYWYLRLRRRSNPDRLARGLAAGVFTGMFPLFGLQMILAVLLSTLIKGDQLLAMAGTWVSNPFTYLPLFTFNFQVGRWLIQSKLEFIYPKSWAEALNLGRQFLLVWFAGCLAVGAIGALVTYLGGLWFFQYIRRQKYSGQAKSGGGGNKA